MKRIVSLLVLVVFTVPFIAGCAGPVGERTRQGFVLGALLGAAAGGVIAGGEGAAAGALIGGGAGAAFGAIVGTKEQQYAYAQPPRLDAIVGKHLAITAHPQFGWYGVSVVRPVLEEQLVLRGAGAIFDLPQRVQSGQIVSVDILVEVAAQERYGAVEVDLRVLDAKTRQVLSVGSDRQPLISGAGYGYTDDSRSAALRTATKAAVWKLAPLASVPPTPPPAAPTPGKG